MSDFIVIVFFLLERAWRAFPEYIYIIYFIFIGKSFGNAPYRYNCFDVT